MTKKASVHICGLKDSINMSSGAYSGSIDERPKAQIAMHNISGKPITSKRPIVGSIKLFPVR